MGYTKQEFPEQTVLNWYQILADAGFEVVLDPVLADAAQLPPGVKPAQFRKGSVKRDDDEVTLIPGFTCHQGERSAFYIYDLGYFLDHPWIRTRRRVAKMKAQRSLAADVIATLEASANR